MNEDKIVLVTGGFDPIHSGHISLIKEARKLGRVVVGLNSDEWLKNKKGVPFQPYAERYEILSNIKDVLCVMEFDDSDGTANNAIRQCQELFPTLQVVFANGGDRTSSNIPELQYCIESGVEVAFGIGGDHKVNSSSWILSDWLSNNFEDRIWGKFKTLYTNGDKIKVKELMIDEGSSISLQRHKRRSEYWVVVSGTARVQLNDSYEMMNEGDSILIDPETIHKLTNVGVGPLKILEVQHGALCDESDIERLDG